MLNLIELLEMLEIDPKQAPRIKRAMSNWIKIADTIYKEAGMDELLAMLKYEAMHKNRGYVIERLHSRYNALRVKREKELLREWRMNWKKR
jgi:hypothetical protein